MNTSEMSDTVENLQDQAQETTQEWKQKAMETARNCGQAADRYVRDNVWTTVAFAALGGCLLGFLLGRSRD